MGAHRFINERSHTVHYHDRLIDRHRLSYTQIDAKPRTAKKQRLLELVHVNRP